MKGLHGGAVEDVYICGTGLQCCLGGSAAEAIATLKRGAVKPSMVDLLDGQRRPYYLMDATTEVQREALGADAWRANVAKSVRTVLNECDGEKLGVGHGTAIFIASSSLDMGGIQQASQLGAPLYEFGNQLAKMLDWSLKPVTVNTACTSAFNALHMAVNQIKSGAHNEAVILGIEAFNPYTLLGFEAMQLLAPQRAEPLGEGRQGLVLGEAIAALHLTSKLNSMETTKRAKAWRIMAFANVVDGRNPTGASESALVQACQQALGQAGLVANDVDLIKLQAAGSPSNDAVEATALRVVFGTPPPCIAPKAVLGHTLGASGAAETALLLACIEHGVWPEIDYAVQASIGMPLVSSLHPMDGKKIRTVLLITLGFGGGHSVLILQKSSS